MCPQCGEDVPPRALACPECGADHESGWREDADLNSLDLGEDQFNYEEFVEDEFGGPKKPRGISTLWWVTAIVLLLGSAIVFLLNSH